MIAQPLYAHETREEFDRFENAVQCAGLWLGDFSASAGSANNADEFSDSQASYETGMTFRRVAIESGGRNVPQADYLISVWSQYFIRLASDSGGSGQFPPVSDASQKQWAGEQFLIHQRYCQSFGLALEDKWGFH